MLYQTVNFTGFIDAFKKVDRDIFSYAGYQALFDYLDEQDEPIEFDVIDLVCLYDELSYDEIIKAYSLDNDTTREDIIEYLYERTCVIYTGADSVLFEIF